MNNTTSITIPQTQLLVNVEDVSLLRAIKAAIRQLKGVTTVKEVKPKVRMTKAEFNEMVSNSAKTVRMDGANQKRVGETMQEYVNRLLAK